MGDGVNTNRVGITTGTLVGVLIGTLVTATIGALVGDLIGADEMGDQVAGAGNGTLVGPT